MHVARLVRILDGFGVRKNAYDLVSGRRDETYTMIPEADGWHVFYSERGGRNEERVYAIEAAAALDRIERIARDPTTRDPTTRDR
jgi:hypothetical protein